MIYKYKNKILLIIFFSVAVNVHAAPAIMLESSQSRYNIVPNLEIFEDTSGKMTIDDVIQDSVLSRFVINTKNYPTFGMNHAVYWGKFTVQNVSSQDSRWYIIFEYPSQEMVNLYLPQKNAHFQVLSHNPDKPFSDRYVKNRKVIFPVEISKGPMTVYFSVKSELTKELPMTLVNAEELARKNYIEMFISGIYYGIIIIMFLYNFFIFIYVRDISYLYYCLFIISFGLIQLSLDGFFLEFISPDHFYLVRDLRVFLASIALSFTLLFGYSYLDIKRYLPPLKKIYLGLIPVANLPMVIYFLAGFYPAAISVRILMVLLAIMQIVVGAVMMVKNDSAKYYFAAWCIFLTASIFFSLRGAGLYIPVLSDYGMQWGNAIEVTILSFGLAHRIRTLQNEKAHLTETFGKIVDPVIRDHLLSGEIEIGGQEKTGTILFGDIRNFTTLSENFAPVEVVKQLNQFFESMSSEISERHGLVNKYIGDGILALYNVPVLNPVHCDNAVQTAIGMNMRLKSLNKDFLKNGVPELNMGIGIHTGSILAGNIGSSIRMEYTVIGDNVNIASRIESLTKVYKTPLLITREVVDQLSNKDNFLIRDIDKLYLKGKSRAVSIYEVFNNDNEEVIRKKQNLLDRFQNARELYSNRQFAEAQTEFEAIHRELPEDNVAHIWAKRCLKYKMTPPHEEEWNGVVSASFITSH